VDTVTQKIEPIDTTGFTLKVFYLSLSQPCQLYASFEFGTLKGIIRFCPSLTSAERQEGFEKLCELNPTERTGPESTKWTMNWRGDFAGERLGESLGWEVNW
jgi:hypothetical protein